MHGYILILTFLTPWADPAAVVTQGYSTLAACHVDGTAQAEYARLAGEAKITAVCVRSQ